MTKHTVIVRDRADGRIVRLRQSDEPAKMRVCRACRRVHEHSAAACRHAA